MMLSRFLTYRNRRYKPLHASPLRNLHRIISASELVYGSAETAEEACRSAKWTVALGASGWTACFILAALGDMGTAFLAALLIGPFQFALLATGARATLIIDDYAARHGLPQSPTPSDRSEAA